MAHLYETILGRLGSRFCLYFKPRRKQVGVGAYGYHLEENLDLTLGVRVGGVVRALPFQRVYPEFPIVEQAVTPTSLTFTAQDHALGLRFVARFTAPYYPQATRLSRAPAFLVEIEVEALKPGQPFEGEIMFALPGAAAVDGMLRRNAGQEWQMDDWFKPENIAPLPKFEGGEMAVLLLDGLDSVKADRFLIPFSIDAETTVARATFGWAAYVGEPVLEADRVARRFAYTTEFSHLGALLETMQHDWQDWLAAAREFDALFSNSTMSKSQRDLLAFAFQSYLANTWWVVDERGDDWWSVWEGACHFHSTVDVEYNLAWFYLLFEPELLKKTLAAWTTRVHDRILAHDMGDWFHANDMAYPHAMPVEENTNFLLLAHAYAKITGDHEPLDAHFATMKTLAEYVLDSDTTGNGFPNEGTANTIDDASPAVQNSKEQTYLAVKALSALAVFAPIAEAKGEADLAARCRTMIDRVNATLAEKAWLGDHYAVCIDKNADGLEDLLTGEKLSGELRGWDAYTLYTSNGLLYLLATDTEPPIDMERITTDLVNAAGKGLCEYGNFHSSADHSNLWVSQNLHRDFIAAYLGLDLSGRADGYLAFEIWENTSGRGGFFIDTYGLNRLNFYPRGATAFGYLMADLGLRINREAKRLTFSPPKAPCRYPIAALADWKARTAPWIEFKIEAGQVTYQIEDEAGLLKDWEIVVQ